MSLIDNPGAIALVGGDEFGSRCESMDRELLGLRPSARPAVAVVPTAAAGQRPELTATNGTRYFESLGAEARGVMAIDEESGNDEDVLRPLTSSGLIYFAGGSPSHLLHVLRSTKLWKIVRSEWAAGAALAGSSAGAMALGGWMFAPGDPPLWVQTIGAVANVGVLPHYERWGNERRDRAVATRPSGITLLGVPGAGGVVFERGAAEGRVIGDLAVTVIDPSGKANMVESGKRFPVASLRR
jgi:cyanophycinase